MIKKILDWSRKNKAALITLLGITLLFTFLLLIPKSQQTETLPTQKQTPYKENVYPGSNTKSETIDKLGEPDKITNWQNYTILNYSSNSKWDHQIFTKDEKIYLITEQTDKNPEITRTKLRGKYGYPSFTLYGPMSPGGNLYAYPQIGFAFIGSDIHEAVFQLWYFPPLSDTEFINTLAKEFNYTTTLPEQGYGYDYGDSSPGLE